MARKKCRFLQRHNCTAVQSNRSRRTPLLSSELLESRVLLAADGLSNGETEIPAYAYIFYALSRGGDSLMQAASTTPLDSQSFSQEVKAAAPVLIESPTETPSTIAAAVLSTASEPIESRVIATATEDSEGENGDKVRFRTQAIDSSGNVLTQVTVGDEFTAQVFVQDIRDDATGDRGVFAAYADIIYNFTLASLGSEGISIGSDFPNGRSTDSPFTGFFNDAGGTASGTPLGTGETLFLEVSLVANTPGEFEIVVDEAELSPQRDVLVFGSSTAVLEDEVEYNGLVLEFVDSEGTPDLVQFAKDLAAADVTFYHADWCSNCTAQKALFEDGARYLPLIEVSNPDRSINQVGIDANISSFPTWTFPDGSRLTGVQSLDILSERSGIPIPKGMTPSFFPLDSVSVYDGAPLYMGIDGYDPDGNIIDYSVVSDNPDVIMASILEGNQSMRFNVGGFGDMVFELFEQQAPRATQQIIDLANEGFYDGLTFHRIANSGRSDPNDAGIPFVIQGGDPDGNGRGGPGFQWDDDFNVNLTHIGSGILSMAKSSDDTNGSQFFVTAADTRFLDFNHSVFGQLVEGDKVRSGVQRTATQFDEFNRDTQEPLFPVTINSIEIFDDTENAMLYLGTVPGASGSANITVTATNEWGETFSQTFTATAADDIANGSPFLQDIDPVETVLNTPVSFQLPAVDAEDDPIDYAVTPAGETFDTLVDENGLVTVTPPDGFLGELTLRATVRQDASIPSHTGDKTDAQVVTITVNPAAPTDVFLLDANSDTGSSSTDLVTSETNLDIVVDGVVDGATVELFLNGETIGEAIASGSQAILPADLSGRGDGSFDLSSRYSSGQFTSPVSSDFVLQIDRMAPAAFTSIPPTTAIGGQLLSYDANSPEEGSVVYTLSSFPAGATINESTGLLHWQPTPDQIGLASFTVEATDVAGNATAQDFNIEVSTDTKLQVRLETTDSNGQIISGTNRGRDFTLNVYMNDVRSDAQGIQQAFVDLTYAPTAIVSMVGGIQHGAGFGVNSSGDTSVVGIISDVGSSSNTMPTDDTLLFSLTFTPDAAGVVDFTTALADMDVLLVGEENALLDSQIEFDSVSFNIVDELSASDDSFSIDEGNPTETIDVLINDILGPNGGTLSISSVDNTGVPGTVSIASNGLSLDYTPDADFAGQFQFTYTASNGLGMTSDATVDVTVNAVNDDPVPVSDTFATDEDMDFVITESQLIANDSAGPANESDQTLTVVAVSPNDVSGGTVFLSNGSVSYSPEHNFNGPFSFTYTVDDGAGGTADADVTITVAAINDPPIGVDDEVSTDEDVVLIINVDDLLANDSPGPANESDQDLRLFLTDSAFDDTLGILTFPGDGTLVYTPPAEFVGQDTFIYQANDLVNGKTDVTVTIDVVSVEDAPVAVDDEASTFQDSGPIIIDVLNNDTDADNQDELIIVSVGEGDNSGATIRIIDDGKNIEYTPASGFIGTDTFEYTIQDSTGNEDTGTATVELAIQGSISGLVFLDTNNNGVQDTNESGIGNVRITLQHREDNGESRHAFTDASGTYMFDSVSPGDYAIIQTQPVFLVNGMEIPGSLGGDVFQTNEISITLVSGDTDAMGYNFAEMGIDTIYANWYSLASMLDRGFVGVAGSQRWYMANDSWADFQSLNLDIDDEFTEITLNATNSDGERSTTDLSMADPTLARAIGKKGNNYLVHVAADATDAVFSDDNGDA